MFITVLHGDDQKSLFNTQCKTVVLLDWIKVKCGCKNEVASDVLAQREEYILISISRTSDPSNPVHTSLLHNYDLHDPQCLAKLREEKTEKKPCASEEANGLSRRLPSSLSTESQPRPYKQIRFSSSPTFQTYSDKPVSTFPILHCGLQTWTTIPRALIHSYHAHLHPISHTITPQFKRIFEAFTLCKVLCVITIPHHKRLYPVPRFDSCSLILFLVSCSRFFPCLVYACLPIA
ncbi:uncharacterized protein LOC128635274 isoform X2 [Ictalurus punctatus]|uniref:Uncharacterized protein LOC128635274 isoform X2 n=1 Tax=Ictalurus punctatus TaxID=7998 RepID=A0A9F7TN25_ICTPU|nr:uncharacterized protein LOC128635274 isoform X2 [Ictalurus punctatus]